MKEDCIHFYGSLCFVPYFNWIFLIISHLDILGCLTIFFKKKIQFYISFNVIHNFSYLLSLLFSVIFFGVAICFCLKIDKIISGIRAETLRSDFVQTSLVLPATHYFSCLFCAVGEE